MNELWSISIILSIIILLGAAVLGWFFGIFYPPTRVIYDKEKDIRKIGIKNIERMDRSGKQFEHYLCVLFSALGYRNVYKTKDGADFGADLIFTDSHGNRTVVQAKNYTKNNRIGNDAVQQVFASMPYYKANKAIVITSSYMTKACEEQASACNVTIIAKSDLVQIIDLFKREKVLAAKRIIERGSKIIEYRPKDRLTIPDITETFIKSGGYYYQIQSKNKKTS